MKKKKAIVLLSGGLDSATTLYYALHKGHDVRGLVFDYGQRHRKEIVAARGLAREAGIPSEVVKIGLPWKGSALLDNSINVPEEFTDEVGRIPVTYVPARNIIFMAFAASFAEAADARAVFIGANAVDYSGYPDCRPEFFQSLQEVFDRGLKTSVEGRKIKIVAPLIKMTKSGIIRLGLRLGVPYEKTWSCYKGGRKPCGVCDSCRLRAKGFDEAGVPDPLLVS